MMESLGVVTIMALIAGKQIHSINSFVLDYENRKNPKPENRSFIENLLAVSSEFVYLNDKISRRALELENNGIVAMDALHVACAEEAHADYFVSCDDVLVRISTRLQILEFRPWACWNLSPGRYFEW
jgi:predicted nucleic acid-binding protein